MFDVEGYIGMTLLLPRSQCPCRKYLFEERKYPLPSRASGVGGSVGITLLPLQHFVNHNTTQFGVIRL